MARFDESGESDNGHMSDDLGPTDEDLLASMLRADDPAGAREAWGTFYNRHSKFLHGICHRAYHYTLGNEGVEELVVETFIRVFESGCHVFKPSGFSDSEANRLRVRAWLAQIAKRLLQDVLRGRRDKPEVGIEQEVLERIADMPCEGSSKMTLEVCRLMEAVLSEREQDVLRMTFLWCDPGKTHQKLPEDVLADLGKRWGMTAENVRQVRKRALKKIEEAYAQLMADSVTARRTDV
jgi:RNA polymerase sigma factor (sigma-70 family)